MQTTTPDRPTASTSPWLRRGGLLLLLGWVAFLTWFVLADMASEGVAKEPVLLLAALWLASGTAWVAPRAGSVLLFAFAAVAAWFFRAPAGLVMLVLPPVACGTLLWLASARRRPGTGPALLCATCLASALGAAAEPLAPAELRFLPRPTAASRSASPTHPGAARPSAAAAAAPARASRCVRAPR